MTLPVKPKRTILPRGTLLDNRFSIEDFLGAGNFGEVYSAHQLIFGRPFRRVALKLFGANLVAPSNVADVLNDAIMLLGLQEENPDLAVARHVIEVYDMGVVATPAPRAFISMKLVPGKQTLEHLVHRFRHAGGMPVALALGYLRQLLKPLAWMHTLDVPIVHGDIKPDNILLADGQTLVVTDFGLAVRMPLSATGGAIQYQAPEQLLQAQAGAPADIYAVGLTLYEMLTGCHPFAEVGLEGLAEDNQPSYVRAQLDARKWELRAPRPDESVGDAAKRIPLPSEYNREVAEHPLLERMMARCLAYRSTQRYPNARVLLDEVEAYLKSQQGLAEMPGPETVVDTSMADAPELVAKTPAARAADAVAMVAQGRADQALALAEELLRAEPGLVPALLAGARAQIARHALPLAKAYCERAQKGSPNDPQVFEVMALIFEAEGQTRLAQTIRQRAGQMREASRSGRRT